MMAHLAFASGDGLALVVLMSIALGHAAKATMLRALFKG